MNRRDFLKIIGLAAPAVALALEPVTRVISETCDFANRATLQVVEAVEPTEIATTIGNEIYAFVKHVFVSLPGQRGVLYSKLFCDENLKIVKIQSEVLGNEVEARQAKVDPLGMIALNTQLMRARGRTELGVTPLELLSPEEPDCQNGGR